MERLQTVEKMAAPGGPKRSRTREEDTKATKKDELELQIIAEQRKLIAESSKLNREYVLAPWVIAASLASALGASLIGGVAVAVISHLWK